MTYNIDTAHAAISDLIRTTNNGKLLITRIPRDLRFYLPYLHAEGRIDYITFMFGLDAVQLA